MVVNPGAEAGGWQVSVGKEEYASAKKKNGKTAANIKLA